MVATTGAARCVVLVPRRKDRVRDSLTSHNEHLQVNLLREIDDTYA